MQQLKVDLVIPIPDDTVLITKTELKELKEQTLKGVYWSMKDLENRTGKKIEWLKENILFKQTIKKQLDVENGGFVYYPKKKGEKWVFLANEMAQFLEDNFYTIFKKKV